MKKGRECLLKIFLVCAIIFFLIEMGSALRVGPANVEYNFAPGLETSIGYSVSHPNPDTEFELYVAGDLSDYVSLDKDNLVGGGVFTATLKLPSFLEKPGKHRILIGVKEKISEKELETSVAMIRTSVTIQVVIDIYVPFPGKYLQISLSSNNANVNESINFELQIDSLGKEDVSVTPMIEITSNNEKVETLYFVDREIKSQERINLHKTLETTNYNPGVYNALAVVDYGGLAKDESEFKIGELVIEMVNYTEQVPIGGLRNFDIEIESGWNNNIDGAYAEVFVLGDLNEELARFKTSPTSLIPWERKVISGFFETSNFEEGFYDANVTLVYYGKDVGKSSSELIKIEFVKEINKLLIIVIVGVILFLVVAGFLIKKYVLKNEKRK